MALRVFEGFAGYGGGSFALRRVKDLNPAFDYDVVAYSEIDPYASELFDANHRHRDGQLIHNYPDITRIDVEEDNFPEFDMFTGGFPCQPFSSAGLQHGENDRLGRGTLFYHIIRLCEARRPRYVFLENVKGLMSKKFDITRQTMQNEFRRLGYVRNINDENEMPLRMVVLNTKDYGIPQNRERVYMFARLGGLPDGFELRPKEQPNNLKLKDFLDPKEFLPKELYLSEAQIEHLKIKHNIESFRVNTPLCFDVYNKKIKTDGYSITITLPEHNSLRIIEPHRSREIIRKMSVTEQFRLMGLEGLKGAGRHVDINFAGHSYTQLSKRAGNGWDVNIISIIFDNIFKQLHEIDNDLYNY